jgi:Zinc finger, C3HC4 type (RING finger)
MAASISVVDRTPLLQTSELTEMPQQQQHSTLGLDGAAASADINEAESGTAGAHLRRRSSAQTAASHSSRRESGEDSRFECNICLDHVHEPVVTRCGHLYCWICLYRWLNSNHTECPVCKAGVSRDNVIPLYGRGQDPVDPRSKPAPGGAGEAIPGRPSAERLQAERPRAANGGFVDRGGVFGGDQFAPGSVTFTAGFGFFPSLFGLQFVSLILTFCHVNL